MRALRAHAVVIPEDRDLFGEPVKDPMRLHNGAYPYRPGTGPAGETCKGCANATSRGHNGRTYWKCALVQPTHGPGTDIRLKTPACRAWRPRP